MILMASHPRIHVLVFYVIVLLIHQQHLELAEALRPSKFNLPAPVKVMRHKPRPTSSDSFSNNHSGYDVALYSPTSPGHSPGMGHEGGSDQPPGA
nr:hypothetical protein CDL12_07956 [Ipomoea batatas]